MKRFLCIALVMVISLSPLCADSVWGQQNKTDALKKAAADIEAKNVNIDTESDSIKRLYRTTLSDIYRKLQRSLESDISFLQQLKAAADLAQSSTSGDIKKEIDRLTTERDNYVQKLGILTGAIQTTIAKSDATSKPVPVDVSSQTSSLQTPNVRTEDNLYRPSVRSLPAVENSSFNAGPSGVKPSNVATTNRTSNEKAKIVQEPAAAPPSTVTLCGQITPVSLIDILTAIRTLRDPAIQALAARFRDSSIPNYYLTHSHLDANCEADDSIAEGAQVQAVVKLLQDLLDVLDGIDRHHATPLQKEALQKFNRATIENQVFLLNGYLGNKVVTITEKVTSGTAPTQTVRTDKDGNYTVDATAGKTYSITTEIDNNQASETTTFPTGTEKSQRVNLSIENHPVSLLTRAVVGWQQSGVASAKKDNNIFFNLYVSKSFPIQQKADPLLGERLRTWGDFRLVSVPQSGDITLANAVSGFSTQVSGLKVNEVSHLVEFLGGLEYRLKGNILLLPSFDRETKQAYSLSAIASFGSVIQTDGPDAPTVFKVNPDVINLFPGAQGKDFIAFVQADRDHFFRQYYAGIRLQGFFFNTNKMPIQRFPTQIDFTVGQNEFVTAGKLHQPVFRLDGYFPLPYEKAKYISLYGTVMLRPGKVKINNTVLFEPPGSTVTVPAANVFVATLPQPNRDYFRLGVGVDFMTVLQKILNPTPKP